jgi:hypothetical protein
MFLLNYKVVSFLSSSSGNYHLPTIGNLGYRETVFQVQTPYSSLHPIAGKRECAHTYTENYKNIFT